MTPSRPTSLGVELEVLSGARTPERFIEEVRGDDPEIAAKLRIEDREIEDGRAGN